jgi:hypothetical protein
MESGLGSRASSGSSFGNFKLIEEKVIPNQPDLRKNTSGLILLYC